MPKYTVYQIQPTRAQYDRVNSEGWGVLDCNDMENLRVKMKLQRGASHYTSDMKRHFFAVAIVEASSLEEVFRLTNLWDDESKVYKLADKMHSLSVGDMIFDGTDFHIVDNIGFVPVVTDLESV